MYVASLLHNFRNAKKEKPKEKSDFDKKLKKKNNAIFRIFLKSAFLFYQSLVAALRYTYKEIIINMESSGSLIDMDSHY